MKTSAHLTLIAAPDLPVEAESLLPEHISGKTADEILAMPLLVGNRMETVGERFTVSVVEEGGDGPAELTLTGDLTRFKRIGEGMTGGRLVVEGSTGFHAGAMMSGGELVITKNAGDYLGAMMSGGRIVVRGNAGHFAGAAYRGFNRGMSGGLIVIHGSAGNLTGARMRRGIIAVRGACGDLAGFGMGAGTVIIGGEPGVRAGANMARGSVIMMTRPKEIMPTFRYNCAGRPGMWPLFSALLARADCVFPEAGPETVFESYSGDFNEGGRGEILLRRSPL